MAHAHRLDEFDAGDRRRAGTIADDLHRFQVAAGQVQRVDQAGGGDDRGAVLVVVKTGMSIASRSRCSMMKQSGA